MPCPDSTKKLSEILSYILPYCTALPEEMGMDYGRRAYIEFARRSGALLKTLGIDLQEGVVDYPLIVPKDHKITRVNWVQIECCRVVVPTYDHNLPGCLTNSTNYSSGSMYGPDYWMPCGRSYFRLDGYDTLILQSPPNKDCENGLVVEVALQPTQDVCCFDADFFDRWVEGISYGALAKAMMLPNTDWYDKQSAQYYDQKFRYEIARAKQKVNLNNSRGPMRMVGRRFV
jgi:hypothetical protein